MAKVLIDHHFNVYGLPDQLHLDIGKEILNNLWRQLIFEFKIQHTTPSSNPVERFHWTLTAMLRTGEPVVQESWDLLLNVSAFAYNTTVSSSTGVTPHYAMFGNEAMLPVDRGVSYEGGKATAPILLPNCK